MHLFKTLYTIGILFLLFCKETKQEVNLQSSAYEEIRFEILDSFKKNNILQKQKPTDFPTIKNDEDKMAFPYDLEGEWAVDCKNGLTTFSIGKEENIISLYGNSIFINVLVEKLSDSEYILKFKNIATQEDWVEESLKISESDISKDKIIGRFFVKKDGNVELHWIGLYNMKKKNTIYGDKDFSLIRESGGKNPILLKKCS